MLGAHEKAPQNGAVSGFLARLASRKGWSGKAGKALDWITSQLVRGAGTACRRKERQLLAERSASWT